MLPLRVWRPVCEGSALDAQFGDKGSGASSTQEVLTEGLFSGGPVGGAALPRAKTLSVCPPRAETPQRRT